ncbi:diaminopimelate decarboxylase-like [Sycon ciliatum]|uniref:diaminopimelate decarboxylase-like n=1 Tax=Sycon ciliatum TaxID=27933 RepID=UPI0020AB4078|eukprot:scpid63401/ scgid19300/ Diaminopimelate decarboxylase
MTTLWEKDQDAENPNVNLAPLTACVDDNDHLQIGGCSVQSLVEQHGSPLYIVDERTVRQSCQAYRAALSKYYPGKSQLFYASKAHCSLAVVSLVYSCGAGVDVVSDGELMTCIRANIPGKDIIYHGNNKSLEEVQLGVEHGVTFVLDNWHELNLIQQVTEKLGKTANVCVRLTPGIECHTHEYVQTGHLDSKFGFDPDQVDELLQRLLGLQERIELVGFHGHIGSQIFELQPHRDLATFMVGAVLKSRKMGFTTVRDLNMGGGLGIRYVPTDDPPNIDAWVRTVCEAVVHEFSKCGSDSGCDSSLPRLICEPGRSIVGTSSVTAYRIGSTKSVPGVRQYVSVDGGMSDNPRPITYESSYTAVLCRSATAPGVDDVRVTGKHCEEGDILLRNVSLPEHQADDVLVMLASGAYHMSMASNYNRVMRPATVLLTGDGSVDVIQRRETYDDILQRDVIPERLAKACAT